MAEIRFTRKAIEDLSDIWNYTADMWSERQADTYYRLLITSCRKLAGNPVLFGREYKELGADIFGFKVNKHIVFYRIAGDKGIEVVRILLSVGRRVVGDLAQRVAAAADLYRPVALVHSPYTVAVFRAIVSPAPPCDNVVVRIRSCPVHAAALVTRRLIRLRVQDKSLNLLIMAD